MAGSPSQSYSYDSLGRTSKITNEYSSDSTVEQNISYLVNGTNQTGRIDTVSYQKNSAGTVTNIAPSLSYDYDANGNITHIYENGVLKIRYYYDGLNRLSREDNSDIDKTVVYSYDKFGNIRSKVEYALSFGELGTAINTVPYRYQSGGGAATKYGDETINYDLDGNMQNYRGYTMTWAKSRQLSALTGNGLTMSFKYDNNSIRTKKTVNGVETEYFYVGDTLVSQKTGEGVINFAYTAGGAPYGFTYNGTSYFYLTNIQGDIIGIYDSTGTVVVEYTYDTWGKLISITGSLASTIGVKNPLRYRGYYYDTETSLYYLQARYYDPDICRFISADALLVAGNDCIQGMNRYAYCINNPVNLIDASGYCYGYPNDPNLDSPFSGVRYGYNCGSYGRHARNPRNAETGNIIANLSDHEANRRPNTGEPGSIWEAPNGDKRKYGPDGKPIWDYDHNDHGKPTEHPHDENGGHNHDWENGVRGKPYVPGLNAIAGVTLVVGCGIGLVFVTINDSTGIGVFDNTFVLTLGSGFKKGMEMLTGG